MWRPWAKSAVKVVHHHHAPSRSQSQSQSQSQSHCFSCSSFKDIQQLCSLPSTDDPDPSPSSPSPSPSSSPSPSPSHRNNKKKQQQQLISRSILCRPLTLSFASPHSLLRSDSAPPSLHKPPVPAAAADPQPQPPPASPPRRAPPGIVVYYTSLRVVRPTFEACRAVQSILRGFCLKIDERDLSMNQGFLAELQRLLGQGKAQDGNHERRSMSLTLTLPRVFIGGRYIGGAEEIRQLHEIGELKKLVEGLPEAEPGVCDACGGCRFVLCAECNGSRKLYAEKSDFKSCTACNENGLVRCPYCSCFPPPHPSPSSISDLTSSKRQ